MHPNYPYVLITLLSLSIVYFLFINTAETRRHYVFSPQCKHVYVRLDLIDPKDLKTTLKWPHHGQLARPYYGETT